MALLVEDAITIEKLKEKLKELFNFKGKFIAIGFVLLFTVAGFSFGRYYPTDSVINTITSTVTKQYEEKIKNDKIIISNLEKELKIADENYCILSDKIKKIKVNYDNVKEPKDIKEIKDRFTKLGYPPIK